MRGSILGQGLVAALALTQPASAQPKVQLQVEDKLPCLDPTRLSAQLHKLVDQNIGTGWTARIRPIGTQGLEVTLNKQGSRVGLRRFPSAPKACEDQRQLVATVLALAIETWLETKPQKKTTRERSSSNPSGKTTRERSSTDKSRSTTRKRSSTSKSGKTARERSRTTRNRTQAPDASRPSSRARVDPATDPASSPGNPTPSSTKPDRRGVPAAKRPKAEPIIASDRGDQARELVRQRAARARAQEQSLRVPWQHQVGLALGVALGQTATAGPSVLLSYVATRRDFSMRGMLIGSYGPPKRLGVTLVHTLLVAAGAELCKSARSAPSPRHAAAACIGWNLGGFWGKGVGSEQDSQGWRLATSPMLALELPLNRSGASAWHLRLDAGVNVIRPRLLILSTQDTSELSAHVLPTLHGALRLSWRY